MAGYNRAKICLNGSNVVATRQSRSTLTQITRHQMLSRGYRTILVPPIELNARCKWQGPSPDTLTKIFRL
jgi:hypothetical protein